MALLIPILAILAATGVISIPIFSNAAKAGSSGSGSHKVGDFFKNAWETIKGWFKRGANAPSNSVDIMTDNGMESAQLYTGDVVNPSIDDNGNNTATSAQTASEPADVATQVATSQATGDGGSAQNSDDQYDYIKKLFAALGLSGLISGEKENYSWMQNYDGIVGNERDYGQAMINDARKWEEYMAGTAYQRTFKDIEAAGFNPWLALQSGGVNPVGHGSVDSGSALGSISTSLSQSITQGNSNSSSAIIVALIAMLARMFAS